MSQGELRTYLGIAPGVGKTYKMLRDGRTKRRSGGDVVVAYWERHGRAATAAQIDDLELLPTHRVAYHGTSFEELDVKRVLERRPKLALVDELAHANLPGDLHEKRWQDVDELLANGISVYTTLNIANLESLRRLVSTITGTRPAEPVPDVFVRSGEIKLVNLEPAALRHRLSQGLVFPKDRADTALSHYFRFANLAAFQELAELWLDDSVADPAGAYRKIHAIGKAGQGEAIVVGLDGSPADEWLIRYAADLARVTNARLVGLHVGLLDSDVNLSRMQLDADCRLLDDLGGKFVQASARDVASGLIRGARGVEATQLVVGSPGSRWSRWFKGSTVGEVLREAGQLPVQVVNVGRRKSGKSRND